MNEKINFLTDNIINKLILSNINKKASYVIKELLENSCDANSKNISLYVENNGLNLIRVIDDGDGIYKNDLQKCGLRYATSKINNESNLNSIWTYGFKGESLYLIKNTSDMVLISKPKDQKYAYKIKYINEFGYNIEECSGRDGTEIIIRNLNYDNVININENVFIPQKLIALTNFDKHFKFYKDGKEFKNLPPCYDSYSIAKRIEELIGEKYLKNATEIKYEKYFMHMNGFISENTVEKNKNYDYLFINKRHINDSFIKKIIKNEINQNYKKNINYCIYINLDPKEFKINKRYDETKITFNKIENIINSIKDALKKYKIKEKINIKIKKKEENNTDLNEDDKFITINKNISKDMLFKPKNKILTIIGNKSLFFELENKIYITNIKSLRYKIILEHAIKQISKFDKLNSRELENTFLINYSNKEKIKKYKNILTKYGFLLEFFFNENILIQGIPEVIFNMPINIEKLINDVINFLDKNIPIFFSINRFDINIINLFIKNIKNDHTFYEFEIDDMYKEIINYYKNEKIWFKKNCFEVSCKKSLNSFKI